MTGEPSELPHNVFLSSFNRLSQETIDAPYHPESWLARARLFSRQGYFELAVADAYKAHMLCDEYIRLQLSEDFIVPEKRLITQSVISILDCPLHIKKFE